MIQKIEILKTIIIIFSLSFTFSAYAETVEEIIKGRKALFSKNYSSAKRVQALASKGEFDKAKSLFTRASEKKIFSKCYNLARKWNSCNIMFIY